MRALREEVGFITSGPSHLAVTVNVVTGNQQETQELVLRMMK